MANVLNEEKKQQVLALGRLGWSLRHIQQTTRIRRETASAYLKAAGIAVRPPSGWGRRAPKPANEVITDPEVNRAARHPEWQLAYCAARLALTTTMRACELRHLRWADINWESELIIINKSKTEAGERVIPLVPDAIAALRDMQKRATEFGTLLASHYVFGSCEHGNYDPTRPMRSWRTAWRNLTTAISCSSCGLLQRPTPVCRNTKCIADTKELISPLAGLRFHDLRHHAITELAESGEASEQTIMALAGHVSPRMLRHYSHVRQEAKRKAIQVLSAPVRA
jgi:integrase